MKNRKYTKISIENNTSSFSVIPAPDNNKEKAAQDDAKTGFVPYSWLTGAGGDSERFLLGEARGILVTFFRVKTWLGPVKHINKAVTFDIFNNQ